MSDGSTPHQQPLEEILIAGGPTALERRRSSGLRLRSATDEEGRSLLQPGEREEPSNSQPSSARAPQVCSRVF